MISGRRPIREYKGSGGISMQRKAYGHLLCLCLLLAPPWESMIAGEKPDPKALVEEFLATDDPGARARVADRLAKAGDAAVAPIMAAWNPTTLDRRDADMLARALGAIDTEQSLAALRRILLISSFSDNDILDEVALAKAVAAPEGEKGQLTPGLKRRVWRLLPEKTQDALRRLAFEDKDAKNTSEAKALTKNDRFALVRALNDIVEMPDFYIAADMGGVKLSEEGEIFRNRLLTGRESPEMGISTKEIQRLNRLLLESLFQKSVAAGPVSLDATVFRGLGAAEALRAIAAMDLSAAREIVLAYRPLGQTHLRAIKAIEGDDRAQDVLVDYLLLDDPGLSSRARQDLSKRFKRNARRADWVMGQVTTRLERDPAPREAHVYDNLLRLCLDLPQPEQAECLVDILRTESKPLRSAALDALGKHLLLLRRVEILDALSWALEKANKENTLRILDLTRKSGMREGIPLAAYCLESGDDDVVHRATEVLAVLAGRDIGRNPEAWRKWLEKNR